MKRQLELNTEYPEPHEQEVTAETIALLKNSIEQRYFTGLTYRDVHSKGHALVRAEFTVEPGLPEEFRVGLFKSPGVYPAWIRYSSSFQDPQADIIADIRGMAIKLMGVPGKKLLEVQAEATTQDFIFLSTDTFLTKNASDFCKFVKSGAMNYSKSLSNLPRIFWFIITHPKAGIGLVTSSRKFANLLEMDWFSATPYLFGNRAVKYGLRPWLPKNSRLPDKPTNNFLRERLISDLARQEAGFDFMIQFQSDPHKEPIENALVPWKTPFHKVASVRLPRQTIGSPEQMAFVENLSFNPWHCLPEHRPLGGANRVRKAVYFAISEFRHNRNGVPVREPVPDENV
jgi:Catalase